MMDTQRRECFAAAYWYLSAHEGAGQDTGRWMDAMHAMGTLMDAHGKSPFLRDLLLACYNEMERAACPA